MKYTQGTIKASWVLWLLETLLGMEFQAGKTAVLTFYDRLLLGPVIGGALFDAFGFRAPFIFGVIAAVLDLVGRLLILERREALEWGHDPALLSTTSAPVVEQPEKSQDESLSNGQHQTPEHSSIDPAVEDIPQSSDLSLWEVSVIILKSHRAMVACLLAAIYGYVDFHIIY